MDAAYDRTGDNFRNRQLAQSLPLKTQPSQAELMSYQALQRYFDRTDFVSVPEGEVMAILDLDTGNLKHDPRISEAIIAQVKKPDYEKVVVPALGIYALATTPDQLMKPWFNQSDIDTRRTVDELFELQNRSRLKQIEQFSSGIRNAEVIVLEDADHVVHVSNKDDVIMAIDRFASTVFADHVESD